MSQLFSNNEDRLLLHHGDGEYDLTADERWWSIDVDTFSVRYYWPDGDHGAAPIPSRHKALRASLV